MDKGASFTNEEWVTFSSDGHRELLETTKTPLRDAKGQVIGVLGIGHDITERHNKKLALIESEDRFRTVFEMSLDAIVLHRNGELLFVNPAAVQMFGAKNAQELLDKPILELIHPDSHKLVLARIKAGTEQGITAHRLEEKYIKLDGTVFDVEAQGQPIVLSGQPAVLATLRDITECKQSMAKLKIAASVFGNVREGITITDTNGTIIDINDSFTRITGYGRTEALGQNSRILKSGRQDVNFYIAMWGDLTAKGFWSGEIWNRRKDGEIYPEQITIQGVRDAQGHNQGYIALFSDITQRKALEAQMHQMAFFDALTGLPNRRMLGDRLNQAMAASKRNGHYGALMFLDLDNFKPLNDIHGHEVGDLLLIEVARRLTECLREVDTVARFGGDEFVVMLTELGADKPLSTVQAARVAEKIRVSVATPYLLAVAQPGEQDKTIEHHCSASIGVVMFVNHEISQSNIMKWADAAMYQAKDAGRNTIQFYEPIK
jgi:diguanylate cyclase (GGDEF)-like protein/PAS domain S-box-containing protein